MKKFITILISCSLALATNVIAQQDQEQQKPKKEKGPPPKSHQATEAKPAPKPQSVPREHAQTNLSGQKKGALKTESAEMTPRPQVETKVHGKEPGNTTVTGQEHGVKGEKGRHARTEAATANKLPSPVPAGASEQSRVGSASQANKPNVQAKKPDPQTIQKIKAEHASFRAQPRPDKVPAATFNQNYRISGSEHWQGRQYEVFRSYHPERHDRGWYHSHFSRIELIGGGYYYWNSGYWYPAWGYDPSAEYCACTMLRSMSVPLRSRPIE